jgi:hypothetical protein
VTNILEYEQILPDETLELIRRRTDGKIDYLLNIADKLIGKSPAYKDSFFKLSKKLDDKKINEKVDLFWYLLTKYSAGVIQDHGLVVFFKTISKGLYWLGTKPQNIEQKIERKLVMKDFRFTIGLLTGIFVLIFSVVIYGSYSKAEEEKQREIQAKIDFTKSLRGFLTEFDPAQATNIQHVDSLYKSGDNPFRREVVNNAYGSDRLMPTNQFTNKTEYDIIIISDDDFAASFEVPPYRYLIKSNDSIRAKHFMMFHLYIGKDLARFNSNEKYIPRKYSKRRMAPRFLQPYKNPKEIISLRIEARGDIRFIQEGDDILIQSGGRISVNGRTKDSIYKL